MPGANYMGGKRSAMMARVKDTVGRKQKGFFGRQRLDVLSQGLSASKPSEKTHLPQLPFPSNNGRVEIDLAHARQKIPLDENTAVGWFIPSPIRISPSTPRSRKRIKTHKAHTSSSSASRSEILDVLDTTEPLFLRRVMDQIVAMPDLAGLAKREGRSLYRREGLDQRTGNERELGKKRKMLDEGEEDSDPRSKIELRKRPKIIKYKPRAPSNFYTPPRKGEGYRNNKSSLSHMYHRDRSERGADITTEVNSEDDSSSADSPDAFKIHDSGFSDFGVEKNVYSSPWSMQQHQSSSQTSEYTNMAFQSEHDISPKFLSSPSSKMLTADTSSPRISEGERRQSQSHSGSEDLSMGLPSAIRLGPSKKRWSGSGTNVLKDEPSVYGSLFQQNDPWRTIGSILRLQETDSEMPRVSVDTLATDENIQQAKDEVFNPPPYPKEVLLEEIWEDGEWAMSEIDSIMEDIWQDQPFVPDWSANQPLSPENNRLERFSPMPLEDVEDWQIDRTESPAFSENLDSDNLSSHIAGNNGPSTPKCLDDMTFDRIPSLGEYVAAIREDTPETMDNQSIDRLPLQDVQDSSDSGKPTDIMMDDKLPDDSYETSQKILATPVLREVNGRFLGPSLFDDFDESEDDS